MNWSRELRMARRSMRTAIKAASAMATAKATLPAALRAPWSAPAPHRGGLIEVADFGTNPGQLSMLVHQPTDPPLRGAPLIVLLHGCGQGAASFAQGTEWIALANQRGIPLVLPEQSEGNNRGRCFNWFRPTHSSRGQGEALSIRQMVAAATRFFESDPTRVFLAGLSAGGAMTAAMLAAYPDVFAGGAVVAGLPVGAANSVPEALRRMAEAGPARSASAWADAVRQAAPVGYRGPWPRVSIWHGDADRVVDPANARLLAQQWSSLHGPDLSAMATVELPGRLWDRWTAAGQTVVELWRLPGLAHDWPRGAVERIADFWNIAAD